MSNVNEKTILITGGTGTLGKALISELLQFHTPKKVIIFSRDEHKQSELRDRFLNDMRLRWFLGDVRDKERLSQALRGVDFVIHAASLKRFYSSEYNPFEVANTNIYGAQNLINSAIQAGVKNVIAISSEQASSPISMYGASKLAADKLFQSGNHYSAGLNTKFSVMRYGSILNSRGNLIPQWKNLAFRNVPINLGDFGMTRFCMDLQSAAKATIRSLSEMKGGEIFIPKCPSVNLLELAQLISPRIEVIETGLLPGEKLHEELLSFDESRNAFEQPDHYIVKPAVHEWEENFDLPNVLSASLNRSINSSSNSEWLSGEKLFRYVNLDS